ncbi:MAG: dihydroorotate dehydrogenase, partial [Treponema sp.]|nr:dihydroorotate dehydrogenase [Treponema sp.]
MVDQAQIDKDGNGILFNGSAKVERIENVAGQRDVFLLQAVYEFERSSQICPRPGQFYMIRTKTSNGYFKRPISVYHSEEFADAATGKRMLRLQFLILQKGEGTKELCSLKVNDDFLVQGPLGNEFALTAELKDVASSAKREICIVGGGIGVAPVANFASSLPAA